MFHFTTKELTFCAILAALTAILSQISIPFASGVPFTLQTLVVLLLAFIAGARLGTLVICLYILLGALGLPVFAEMSGGAQVLIGPTGGFLWSFPLMVYILGLVYKQTNRFSLLFSTAVLVSIGNLLIGSGQFMIVMGVSFEQALIACFWPFLFFAIIKSLLAIIIGKKVANHPAFQQTLPL